MNPLPPVCTENGANKVKHAVNLLRCVDVYAKAEGTPCVRGLMGGRKGRKGRKGLKVTAIGGVGGQKTEIFFFFFFFRLLISLLFPVKRDICKQGFRADIIQSSVISRSCVFLV